jgi:hypothetical protein
MSKEFRDKVEEALRILIDTDSVGKDYIASGWVLISEWADYEGGRFLHTQVSEAMTPWNAAGMMQLAEEYNSELIENTTEIEDDQ